MKQVKVALCFLDDEENIVVKKLLESNWDVAKLKEFHHLLIKDEVSEIMAEAIKIGVSTEVIKQMLEELEEK